MPTCETPAQVTWHGGAMCGHPRADVQHHRGAQGSSKKCSSCCPFSCSSPWPWCWALGGHHLRAVGLLQQEKVPASQGFTSVTAEEHARGQENLKCSTLDLQIRAHGLTIPALKPTANLPLLPASAIAAHTAPCTGQNLSTMGWVTHSTSTASRVQMWAAEKRVPKAEG